MNDIYLDQTNLLFTRIFEGAHLNSEKFVTQIAHLTLAIIMISEQCIFSMRSDDGKRIYFKRMKAIAWVSHTSHETEENICHMIGV